MTLLLLGIDFLDELCAGVPMIGAPDIQAEFGVNYSITALVLLVLPHVLGLLVEPPVYILSDRYPRKWFVCGGLLAMAVTALVAGVAPSIWILAPAVAGFALASGIGVSLGQATLMDAYPEKREQLMTRWTMMGMLGDLAAPGLFTALAYMALGWREAFLLVGVILACYTAILWRRPFPEPAPPQDKIPDSDAHAPVAIRSSVRAALGNRTLMAWLFGVWLCDLLDEILIVFAALHLRDGLGADAAARAAILTACMVGSGVGLMATELCLRRLQPRHMLLVCSALCTASFLVWLTVTDLWLSGALLFLVGATVSPLYPIAKAQAYRALPGQSGMMLALGHLFTPFSVALPYALGWIADHVGLIEALLVLTAQPIGLFAIAILTRPRS